MPQDGGRFDYSTLMNLLLKRLDTIVSQKHIFSYDYLHFSFLKNIIQLIPSEMFHAFKLCSIYTYLTRDLKWSNTSVIESNQPTEPGLFLNLLINISNSYLHNKLSSL